MKILFLDIDGVLNSFDNQFSLNNAYKGNYGKSMDEFGILFDERCINWLKHIIIKTGCLLVISSTWRLSGIISIRNMWDKRKLPGIVHDITPVNVPIDIYERYSSKSAIRGYEIQAWIDEHKVEKYCIVDDDSDMLDSQKFVKTSGRIGLNYETAKSIIYILNK